MPRRPIPHRPTARSTETRPPRRRRRQPFPAPTSAPAESTP
jgi:hypothetical protein